MPQKVIRFTGINRKANEFNSIGACEEMINIRPTANGLEVVRPKKVKFSNVQYDVYNHAFGDRSLFVGIIAAEADDFVVYLIAEDGSKTEIDSFTNGTEEYDIAFIGNQMLLTTNGILRVYAYKDGKYTKVDTGIPNDLDITCTTSTGYGASKAVTLDNSNPKDNLFKNALVENWSAAMGENSRKDEIFGPVMVAFNYTLKDGTEFWTNKWIYVNPFIATDNGKHKIYSESGSKSFIFKAYKVSFTIPQTQFSTAGTESMVKSLNIYASRPIFPYNLDTMTVNTESVREIYANVMGMKESEIDKQLLYFQKSIPVEELESAGKYITLDFGESQAGEKVLEVDAGPVKRTGKVASFNNRAHFYDSQATIYPQSVICDSNDALTQFATKDAFVHLECGDTTIVCHTTAQVPASYTDGTAAKKIYCTYPDARAKKILIACGSGYCTINLEPSDRYNYAYGEGSYYPSYSSKDIVPTLNVYNEPNTINVSAQYNPFVFPVEYSYSFGGKILDLATSYLPISATQIGQYPMTVFTTSGIYALEQGSGASLYGNITPLQPLVIEGKACPTPYGTFFTSSKSLYILNGREVADVSTILKGEMETNVRTTNAYQNLVCNGDGLLYDFFRHISNTDFENYVEGAHLTYDQLNNELIISSANSAIPYSYVFNLDTKAFHKINARVFNTPAGARYALMMGVRRDVVDLHTEVTAKSNQSQQPEQPILLQSRPFSLEALSTHIDRLMLLVDANLEGEQALCLTVFGSDNLYDWKCIISSQKVDVALRHIRTNRAARSYKEYIVLINGIVYTSTDIAELIADYSVVQRRLG